MVYEKEKKSYDIEIRFWEIRSLVARLALMQGIKKSGGGKILQVSWE